MRISSFISSRNLRIGGASLVAVLMIAGGYFLPGFKFPKTRAVNAELTDDLLASYVAKDTDSDGLPDWQEVLYGTDVNKADTDGDGISDGEAVKRGLLTPNALASQIPQDPIGEDEPLPGQAPTAGSMTDQFAKSFFQAYMEASAGQPMTAEDQQALIDQLLTDFTARGASALGSSYAQVSIHTDPSMSLHDYAAAMQATLNANDVPEESDPFLLAQAVMEHKDEAARKKLSTLADAEAATVSDLLKMRVPPTMVSDHLLMIRSLDSLAKCTRMIVNYEKDPIGVMSALGLYAPTSRSYLESLESMATKILAQSGEPAPGTPEAFMVNNGRILSGL